MSKPTFEQVIEESQNFVSELRNTFHTSPELSHDTSRCAKEIQRSLRRFDSHLLLMATIGSVKSGKSTLTNCLVKRELCKTTLGVETTRLPLIILASQDGTERMELFYSKATGQLDEEELFEQVIDYLKGIQENDFNEKISIERCPLNEEQLNRWAKGESSANCAAIFLMEPTSPLLQAGYGIIDMPGMDGLDSNWQEEKLHTWMNKHADYFLLVQSSFAALTPDTRNYLKKAKENSPRPIRVVQNRIMAQSWLGEEEQITAQNEQQLNTQKQLRHFLQQIIPSSWVNAGLAWFQQHSEELPCTQMSNLTALEKDILSDLSSPESTLQHNSFNVLFQSLEAAEQSLIHAEKRAQDILSNFNKIDSDVKMLLDDAELREHLQSGNMNLGRQKIELLANAALEKSNAQLDLILDLKTDKYFPPSWSEHKMSGLELNTYLDNVETDMGEFLSAQETHILSPIKQCELTEMELHKIAQCADILQRRKAEDIEKDYTSLILAAWKDIKIDASPFNLGELEETKLLFFKAVYDYLETKSPWRIAGQKEIRSRLSDWKKATHEQLGTFITERIELLKQCILNELNRFHESNKTDSTRDLMKHDLVVITELRKQLAPVLLKARQINATK